MKTTILKIFFPVFCLATLLSSCLGDNESKVSATNAFVYIKDHSGTEVAIVDGYRVGIINESLNQLSVGDCAYVDFKFTDANSLGSGIYKADYININLDEDYDFTSSRQKRIHTNSVDTMPLSDSINVFVNFNKASEYIYPDMGNRMLFVYTYRAYENEEVNVEFYYDTTKQNEFPENATKYGVIDVRLNKTDIPGKAQGNATNRTKYIVADFSNVYSSFEKYSVQYAAPVRFRYYKFSSNNSYPLTTDNLGAYMLYATNEE